MLERTKRRRGLTISIFGLVISIVMLLGALGVRMVLAQSAETASDVYYFGSWEPNHTYHVQYTRYKRFGPQKESIESNTNALLGPEKSITDGFITVGEDGQPKGILQTVKSEGGDLYYTYSRASTDSPLKVIDHKFGEEFEYMPSAQGKATGYASPEKNLSEVLITSGWKIVGEGIFNGHKTLIYSYISPINKTQVAPTEGQFFAPVYYDLAPTSFRCEIQLDSVTGVMLTSARYAVDNVENETLIEMWSLGMLLEEK